MTSKIYIPSPILVNTGNDNQVDTVSPNMLFGAVATRAGNDDTVDTATNMILGAVATSVGNDDTVDTAPARGVALKTRQKTEKPPLYKVLMLNDDYTPMEFVVLVLQHFFRKSLDEATHIMLMIHQKGVGVCGIYTHEVAETKAKQVMELARQHEHPLQLQIEKD